MKRIAVPGGRTEVIASLAMTAGFLGLAVLTGDWVDYVVAVAGAGGAVGFRLWPGRPWFAVPAAPAAAGLAILAVSVLSSGLGRLGSVLAGLGFLYWLLSTELPIAPAPVGDGSDGPLEGRELVATVVLGVGFLGLAALGGTLFDLAVAIGGVGVAFAIRRWPNGPGLAAAGIPAVLALGILVLTVTPSAAAEIVAALSGLAFLFWLGASGPTGASWAGRIGALALPGLAAGIALATSVALPVVPTGFGLGLAAGLVVAALLVSAIALGRPASLGSAPPAS